MARKTIRQALNRNNLPKCNVGRTFFVGPKFCIKKRNLGVKSWVVIASAVGMVLRDHCGEPIFAACRNLPHCNDATEAEIIAIDRGRPMTGLALDAAEG